MSELDDIRKRKLAELQASQNKDAEINAQIAQLEAVTREHMTREALARLGNIRSADPERAMQVTIVIAQLLQSGRVRTIDDELLKQVLKELTPKRDFKIIRK